MLSKKVLKVNTSGLRELFELAKTVINPIDLSLGVPVHDTPDPVKKAMISNIISHQSGYSSNAGNNEARIRIAKKLNLKNRISAVPEQVIITSGTTAALYMSILVLVNPGDEIIILDPYFVSYDQMVKLSGAKPVYVSTYPDWNLPIEKIRTAINDKTKAIIFNNPNNPTGKVYSEKEVKSLAELAKKKGIWIISDEVYEELVYQGKHFSIGAFYDKTITLMGPAKAAAMSGFRIAYLHAEKEIIKEMIKIQQLLYVCAPIPAQAGLIKSLEIDYTRIKKIYTERASMVKKILGDYPGIQGALYAFLPVQGSNATEISRKLIQDKVIVSPGKVFSKQDSHIRISYSVEMKILENGLKRISKYL